MNGNEYVLDTNIISYYIQGDTSLSAYFNKTTIYISFITELELLAVPGLNENAYGVIKRFLNSCNISEVNSTIKNFAIEYKRRYKLLLPDAIIAATAAYLNTPLVTADKGFKKLPLHVIYVTRPIRIH